jgi:hypothetical protein
MFMVWWHPWRQALEIHRDSMGAYFADTGSMKEKGGRSKADLGSRQPKPKSADPVKGHIMRRALKGFADAGRLSAASS